MNITQILNQKNAVSLMLLGQVNFDSGLKMMKRLREDQKKVSDASYDALQQDEAIEDQFARFSGNQSTTEPLDVNANLVVASLIAAHGIEDKESNFLKRNIKSPKSIVIDSMDWMADKEAQSRLMTAQKFNRTVSVDILLATIKAQNNGKVIEFVTNAQGAVYPGVGELDYDDLVNLIETTWSKKDWKAKLDDSIVGLFEAAAKRIDRGEFADLPNDIIDYANEVLKAKQATAQ